MNCLYVFCRKSPYPIGRQIHVDQDLHAGASGSSISSTRHAAYERASRRSSSSRYGYAFRISPKEWPAATSPTIVPTVTRKPRMQGFPPMTLGSNVILASCVIKCGTTFLSRDLLHSIIHRVPFHRFKTRVLDELNDLGLRHLYLTVLNCVAFGQLAAFGDGAVEVIGAVVEGRLGEVFAEHHPVGFDVVKIVEHQARDRHGFE